MGEQVHAIQSDRDLKQRLGPQRRCFGLVHNNMPKVALAFVHVALGPTLASTMREILPVDSTINAEQEKNMEHAIFYSISSPFKGLAGVDLGHNLIAGAMNAIQKELPNIKQYHTLSPMPIFAKWVQQKKSSSATFTKDQLMQITAEYLTHTGSDKRVLDPVGMVSNQLHSNIRQLTFI